MVNQIRTVCELPFDSDYIVHNYTNYAIKHSDYCVLPHKVVPSTLCKGV